MLRGGGHCFFARRFVEKFDGVPCLFYAAPVNGLFGSKNGREPSFKSTWMVENAAGWRRALLG
jgi:hypothetical protein